MAKRSAMRSNRTGALANRLLALSGRSELFKAAHNLQAAFALSTSAPVGG